MAYSAEQIKLFGKGVERSIGLRIDLLNETDQAQSELLKKLKDDIILSIQKANSTIGANESGSYSNDLQLTMAELESVFVEVQKNYAGLLLENGIKNFQDFKRLIGLDLDKPVNKPEDVAVVFHGLQEVSLFGQKIEFTMPLGISKQIADNYRQALQQIEKRQDLRPYITSETRLTAYDGVRVEFNIQKEGKKVKYLATPECVLRINKEPPPEEKTEYIRLVTGISRIRDELRIVLFEDKSLSNQTQSDILYRSVERSKIPEKYLPLVDKMSQLKERRRLLEEKQQDLEVRTLFDETSGSVVLERNNYLSYKRQFSYHYLGPDGKDNRILNYDGRNKTEERIYDAVGNRVIHFRDDGSVKAIDFVNAKGVTYKKDVYSGGVINRSEQLDDGSWDRAVVFNGTEIRSFEAEKKRNPELTEADYISLVKKCVTTKDSLFCFEETCLQYAEKEPVAGLALTIRAYGKEITGVADQEKSLEAKYGIDIETELFKSETTGCKRYSIKNLELALAKIGQWMGRYPAVFLQNSGLKKIFVFDNWFDIEKNDSGTVKHSIGGRSFGNGEIGINGSDESTIHHELFHCIDFHYAGSSKGDETWGVRAHGVNYRGLYGRSGTDFLRHGNRSGARPEGFVRIYGKEGGIDEDQATIVEALMTNQPVLEFISQDPALAEKVKMIKEFYYALSDGRMDRKFWDDLKNGVEINDAYWAQREAKQDFVVDQGSDPLPKIVQNGLQLAGTMQPTARTVFERLKIWLRGRLLRKEKFRSKDS
ncbi:MAG: hypothetical protein V1936_00885 [Patescibacteria group bacterium]